MKKIVRICAFMIVLMMASCLYAEIEIWTASDLYDIRNELDESYIQKADIDVSEYSHGEGWEPIGTNITPFSGSLNGNGFIISNLNINRPTQDNQALFGSTSGAQLSNIVLRNTNITGNYYVGTLVGNFGNSSVIDNCNSDCYVSGGFYVGGLVGWISNQSSISNSHTTGFISGDCTAGALAGVCYNNSTISGSYSSASVFGNDELGGIVGTNYNSSTVSVCYSTGDIFGNDKIGGVVGLNDNSTLTNCYFNGSVSGNDKVGGIAGYNDDSSIIKSFSSGVVSGELSTGGLIGGQSGSSTSDSYWDIDVSGQSSSAGGEGRTTDEMTYPYAANTYLSWDFSDVWGEDVDLTHNNGYPYLRNVTVSVDTPHPVFDKKIAAYPNPFKGSTSVDFMIDKTTRGDLSVYNIRGQKVCTLHDGLFQGKMISHYTWNGCDSHGKQAGAGVYLIILKTDDILINKKIVLTQ